VAHQEQRTQITIESCGQGKGYVRIRRGDRVATLIFNSYGIFAARNCPHVNHHDIWVASRVLRRCGLLRAQR
jgi:hypothetical protein